MDIKLIPHPSTPCEHIDSFEVFIEREAKAIRVQYRVSGNVGEIQLPECRTPERRDELWQHTCFELFARARFGTRYWELNFSPSTCWAAYEFEGYRAGVRNLRISAPAIQLRRGAGVLTLSAEVDCSTIAAAPDDDLRLALAAVIEDRHGGKSYWALAHPSPKPDFHHPDAFTLVIRSGVSR